VVGIAMLKCGAAILKVLKPLKALLCIYTSREIVRIAKEFFLKIMLKRINVCCQYKSETYFYDGM
jgi:hypothetical protein